MRVPRKLKKKQRKLMEFIQDRMYAAMVAAQEYKIYSAGIPLGIVNAGEQLMIKKKEIV